MYNLGDNERDCFWLIRSPLIVILISVATSTFHIFFPCRAYVLRSFSPHYIGYIFENTIFIESTLNRQTEYHKNDKIPTVPERVNPELRFLFDRKQCFCRRITNKSEHIISRLNPIYNCIQKLSHLFGCLMTVNI